MLIQRGALRLRKLFTINKAGFSIIYNYFLLLAFCTYYPHITSSRVTGRMPGGEYRNVKAKEVLTKLCLCHAVCVRTICRQLLIEPSQHSYKPNVENMA